jgi:predicted dehydrogenase
MFCHWRYVLDHTFGMVNAVSCIGATHIPERVDENGQRYACTADDAAYGSFELDGNIFVQINSSWTTRVYRDELFNLQVDGTEGSAIAGLCSGRCFFATWWWTSHSRMTLWMQLAVFSSRNLA